MRVSNALVINRQKQRDSFIKRVIDDAHIEYGKQKMKTLLHKNDEGAEMLFEDSSHFIEMTPRNPVDQEIKEEKKEEDEDFGDFYKDYADRATI